MRKEAARQNLLVLLTVILLTGLCIGGLWAYVQGADAETSVQETSLAQIPETNKIAYTPEKYDNFMVGDVDLNLELERYEGSGLSKQEFLRLSDLLKMYAEGKRPASKAPSLPLEDGFAIIPLDPKSFGGMTEYYMLPMTELSDEQLLMLIDYSSLKGETFGLATTSWKNCTREGFPGSNRYLSAGETLRRDNLLNRLKKEGIRPVSSELTLDKLPVSAIGSIRFIKRPKRPGIFHLYPLRELTDDELMQTLYLDYLDGFAYINPSMDDSLDPIADEQRMRALFEELMDMPASAENTELTYQQKIDTGEKTLHIRFKSALINGVETNYIAILKMRTGEILYITRKQNVIYNPDEAYYTDQSNANVDEHDRRWKDIANAVISKLTPTKVTGIRVNDVAGTPDGDFLTIGLDVSLEDGCSYSISILVADEMVTSAQFAHHVNQDLDYQW